MKKIILTFKLPMKKEEQVAQRKLAQKYHKEGVKKIEFRFAT